MLGEATKAAAELGSNSLRGSFSVLVPLLHQSMTVTTFVVILPPSSSILRLFYYRRQSIAIPCQGLGIDLNGSKAIVYKSTTMKEEVIF